MQETIITVAKKIDKLKYDPAIGSFKGWLLQITRWRIADQFRKREPGNRKFPRSTDDRATATIERVADSQGVDLDALWEKEWQENLLEAAMTRVKKKSRSETIPNLRLLCTKGMARAKGGRAAKSQHRPGLPRPAPCLGNAEEGNQGAAEDLRLAQLPPGIASPADPV